MTDWMQELASHYEKMRTRYPEDKLLIVFDIDGTILDMRHMMLRLLQQYDRSHGTEFFHHAVTSDIKVHEGQVDQLLEDLQVAPENREKVRNWYVEHFWLPFSIFEAHSPYHGVLDVIRWFQLQANTFVGLNTGRPERLRPQTLAFLNRLGKEYRVRFEDDLLYMNPSSEAKGVTESKASGIAQFVRRGFRVVAFVDNEPENLKAVSETDCLQEILLLHAETIFRSKRAHIPAGAVGGRHYDLAGLMSSAPLPSHVQFVWRWSDRSKDVALFLRSNIHWAEVRVRLLSPADRIVLRGEGPEDGPVAGNGRSERVDEVLAILASRQKGVKLDLQEGGRAVHAVLETLAGCGFGDDVVWFNGNVERIGEQGFRAIRNAYPGAIVQCPVDFMAPIVIGEPRKAKEIFDVFTGWGVNRFSISWMTPDKRSLFDQMDRWDFDVNIYDVPNLEAFLQAVLLLPRSITSDFDLSRWYNRLGSAAGPAAAPAAGFGSSEYDAAAPPRSGFLPSSEAAERSVQPGR